jgi:hypothetical protein
MKRNRLVPDDPPRVFNRQGARSALVRKHRPRGHDCPLPPLCASATDDFDTVIRGISQEDFDIVGHAVAAAKSRHFLPLPGLDQAKEAQLAKDRISDLHALYGELGSGRLVIAGGQARAKAGSRAVAARRPRS